MKATCTRWTELFPLDVDIPDRKLSHTSTFCLTMHFDLHFVGTLWQSVF